MKKIILSCLTGLLLMSVYAQDNNVKLNLLPLAWGEVRLGYERVINENQTAHIQLGYLIPRSLPTSLYDASDVEDYGGTIDLSNRITGCSVSGEYRFYTSSSKDAPTGFYFGPYVKWNRYTAETSAGVGYEATPQEFADLTAEQQLTANLNGSGNYDLDVTASFDVSVRQVGLGVTIGYQWVIGEVFTIDWNFFGLGVDSYLFSADITSEDIDIDLNRFGEDIEREVADFDVVGDKIDVTVESDRIGAEGPFYLT